MYALNNTNAVLLCAPLLLSSHPAFACTPGVRRLKPCRHQQVPTRQHEIHDTDNVAVWFRRRLALWWQFTAWPRLLHHVATSDLQLEGESRFTAIGIVLPRAIGAEGGAFGTGTAITGGDVAGSVDGHEL